MTSFAWSTPIPPSPGAWHHFGGFREGGRGRDYPSGNELGLGSFNVAWAPYTYRLRDLALMTAAADAEVLRPPYFPPPSPLPLLDAAVLRAYKGEPIPQYLQSYGGRCAANDYAVWTVGDRLKCASDLIIS